MPTTPESALANPLKKVTGPMSTYRWKICALLFFATTINYLDRQVLSLDG